MPVASLLLALTAGTGWQVLPLVEVERGVPVRCGYIYRDGAGLELRVEKSLHGGAVLTALQLTGADGMDLSTRSFDSRRHLRPAVSAASPGVRLEADLQEVDAGGALFAELGISGGLLRVVHSPVGTEHREWREVNLPAPLPRDVTATYLNCAGDLIRPE